MPGERNGRPLSPPADWKKHRVALLGLALLLGGCGTSNLLGSGTIFGSSKTASSDAAPAESVTDSTDVECPGVTVRTGAATLMIGGPSSEGDPTALDLRYQGTIVRTARECHVNAGVMAIKVGIEGRIITGPAGGPGTVDVPLRFAVVHEGPAPKTIMSKLVVIPVIIANAVDRVTFTHVESDISFPMPVPAGDIDAYVVYVGFDPQGVPAKKPPAAKRKSKPAAKPKQS